MKKITNFLKQAFSKLLSKLFPNTNPQQGEITPAKAERNQKAAEVAENLSIDIKKVAVALLLALADLAPEEQRKAWEHAMGRTVNRKYPTVKIMQESIDELYPSSKFSTKENPPKNQDDEETKQSEAELHDLDFFRKNFPKKGTSATSHRLFWLLLSAPERVQKTCAHILVSIAQGVVTKSDILQLLDSPEELRANRKHKAK